MTEPIREKPRSPRLDAAVELRGLEQRYRPRVRLSDEKALALFVQRFTSDAVNSLPAALHQIGDFLDFGDLLGGGSADLAKDLTITRRVVADKLHAITRNSQEQAPLVSATNELLKWLSGVSTDMKQFVALLHTPGVRDVIKQHAVQSSMLAAQLLFEAEAMIPADLRNGESHLQRQILTAYKSNDLESLVLRLLPAKERELDMLFLEHYELVGESDRQKMDSLMKAARAVQQVTTTTSSFLTAFEKQTQQGAGGGLPR